MLLFCCRCGFALFVGCCGRVCVVVSLFALCPVLVLLFRLVVWSLVFLGVPVGFVVSIFPSFFRGFGFVDFPAFVCAVVSVSVGVSVVRCMSAVGSVSALLVCVRQDGGGAVVFFLASVGSVAVFLMVSGVLCSSLFWPPATRFVWADVAVFAVSSEFASFCCVEVCACVAACVA